VGFKCTSAGSGHGLREVAALSRLTCMFAVSCAVGNASGTVGLSKDQELPDFGGVSAIRSVSPRGVRVAWSTRDVGFGGRWGSAWNCHIRGRGAAGGPQMAIKKAPGRHRDRGSSCRLVVRLSHHRGRLHRFGRETVACQVAGQVSSRTEGKLHVAVHPTNRQQVCFTHRQPARRGSAMGRANTDRGVS
jgi:hypothetical protein